MKIKLILQIIVLTLILPLSASAVGIGWSEEQIDLAYGEVKCMIYSVDNIPKGEQAYLEFEESIKDMVVSVNPKKLKDGESNQVQVCFKGKNSASGEVSAVSKSASGSGASSAVGMVVAAPLKINVSKPNYLIPSLIGVFGAILIVSALLIRKFK